VVKEFRHQAGREWTALEAFYLSDQKQASLLAMPRPLRWLYRSWWLLTSLLSKLTSHRRVLLGIALAIAVANLPRAHFQILGSVIGFPRPGALFGTLHGMCGCTACPPTTSAATWSIISVSTIGVMPSCWAMLRARHCRRRS
jgi:hypothetical protein